ncbi:DNA replication ATP-dependent helicase/nuclease DNA2 [Dermacentor albipictus]|uniref:DNA replication ATP-dependent helicase/nuclease DNA2 n=1 Tax=Dermacentor albipictus TaxID=60249 RepID=UPI0038FC7DA2
MMRPCNTGATMKTKKQTSLSKGQRLLSGYFNKSLKEPTLGEANTEKKGSPSLSQDVIDLSDDDVVPPTQCQQACKSVLTKRTAIGRPPVKIPLKQLGTETLIERTLPKPLRLRSSPAKQLSRSASSKTDTVLQTKRKHEDEVDQCVNVDFKRSPFVQNSKIVAGANVLHSFQATKENIPEEKASLKQFCQGGSEDLITEKTRTGDENAQVNLACGENNPVDDWGLDDDFDFGNESLDFDISAVPVYRSVKAVVRDISYATPGCVHLTVHQTASQEELECILKGSWQNEKVCLGDFIYIHAKFVGKTATIDSEGGLIVTNPDMLVNSTSIVASLFCTRKSVLASKFRDIDGSNVTMLVGSIAHELFQKAVTRNASKDEMLEILNKVLHRNDFLSEMYSLNTSETEVRELLVKLLPNISRWIKDYMGTKLPADGKQGLLVTEVRDIEDNYWCPRIGIKGKVDATLEVKVHNHRQLVPLELKTGRHTFSSEHKGQVILYAMMMAERQATDVEEGLLLYIRDCVDMQRVPSRHAERRDLLQRRNELASYLADATGVLPTPIDSQRFCPKCPYATTCSIYRRSTAEGRTSQLEIQPEPQFVMDSVKHLSAEHISYFLDWCSMLNMEVEHAKRDLQDRFWVEDATKRENKGLCFSSVKLARDREILSVNEQAFRHAFHRSGSSSLGSFTKCFGLHVGDRIAVSEQESLTCVAVATGTVTTVANDEVVLDLDKNMHTCQEWQTKTYRIDKVYSSASFTISYSNLARLMSAEPESDKLRSLVIDRSMPVYRKTLSKEIAVACHAVLKPLNNFQRRAILKFLMSEDYVLFKGMPGTGKTTTIAALVQALVLLKKRVLLTSYTHSGVDSVLLKLKARGVPFVRLGATSKVHPDLKEFSASNLTATISTTLGLQEFYESQLVVACTCLGSGQGPLKRLRFDACIVDEASQALQPACLGPLFLARSFVLVGDTQQLPPVVQSDDARKKGMDESLFARLERPENTVVLPVQYRMNREITAVCNKLTYAGQLECGSDDVANASLSLPNLPSTLGRVLPPDSWMLKATSKELEAAVVFVCTDALASSHEDTSDRKGTTSGIEVTIILQLVAVLIKGGLPPEEVGVIAPFRNQVQLLKQAVSRTVQVDISTVDQFQGKEKSVVLLSCVKKYTGDSKETEILNDQRRLTVAVSRARHKLIIVGSSSTLRKYKPFEKLLSFLREDQFLRLQSGDESRYKESALQN